MPSMIQCCGAGCSQVRPVSRLAVVVLSCFPLVTQAQAIKGLIHNEDETDFFWRVSLVEGKAGDAVDEYVDVMARAGVRTFLCNTNARRTHYRSRVWDAYWDGCDPNGPDDQPFLAPMPREEVSAYRKGVNNMLVVHKEGIDYPARVIARCRHNGMSPWISLRMNDCHNNDIPNHPFHGAFWRQNPQFRRQGVSGYFATCLDYAHQEVRDYFRSLIAESLDRYDIDGLELDFMREPYLFSAGKEEEGARILTTWMREVRKLTAEAAARRGHPVRLGVRVPSRPEVALGWGLDAVTWAREGLIELLVVTPRWATIEFDMPIQRWRQMLAGSQVTLAGGLEILYRPCPDGPAVQVTPEQAIGAAYSVLSRGADAVYLFNYFQKSTAWPHPTYLSTLKAMNSLDALGGLPRCVGVTYRDITGPSEHYRPPLPATGRELAFTIELGRGRLQERPCELLIGLGPSPDSSVAAPAVQVNGQGCAVRDDTTRNGLRLIALRVPPAAVSESGSCVVKITSVNSDALTIRRIEASLLQTRQ
ncbi:MAG TPA: hypothetical protein PKY77_04210 [Phycisphaerae bacterium]|nr:hypothetical protein [Phycisphaerae bacterium]HRY67023.1 hypothetical protein [Phycisphaerae bacterium]